jgi:hypothetical protein
MKPIMVNLWAPPGVGKSMTAAMVFNVLKHKGYRAELTLEYAKDVTYEENWSVLKDQFYLAAMQERRNSRLIGNVDIIVTDSPPGLGLVYAPSGDRGLLWHLVMHFRQRYRNVDWLLTRDPDRPYQTYGRTQTVEESEGLHSVVVKEMQAVCGKVYSTTRADNLAAVYIADALIRSIERGDI